MGSWGTGLYSGDFAMDLRSAVSAVARLPFDGDRLVDILAEGEARAAKNPDDEDHATFWLVLADQFAKRGIVCARVRDQAMQVIDEGVDLTMMSKLGMKPRDLTKRRKMLAELRERVTATAHTAKSRPVLKKPQAFVMEAGDILVYPTSRGQCINSYFSSKEKIPNWQHDGWSAIVIVECGRVFDFLAWYRPLTISQARSDKPALADLQSVPWWVLKWPGTCSPTHFKRMELEKIGSVRIDREKLARAFPTMPAARSAVVGDIGLANHLSVCTKLLEVMMPAPGSPPDLSRDRPYPTIASLAEITRS